MDILGASLKTSKARNEPSSIIDGFNLNPVRQSNDKIDAARLVDALDKVKNVGELKKQISSAKKRTSTLDVPLHKRAKERIERAVAYDQAKKRVGFWDETVRQNRLEEKLTFPLQKPDFEPATLENVIERFTPKTDLEIETAKLLNSSKCNLSADFEYTEAEKEALKAMSLEEAEKRKEKLCKMRALISYRTAENRRKGAIKSKRYRRIAKKQKRKEIEKEILELLRKNDPQGAKEKLELLELDRIKERSTLKHRSTGKWAKQIRQIAKKDPQLREALQTQLRLGKELAEKVFALNQESHEESDQSDFDDEKEGTNEKTSRDEPKMPKKSAPIIDLTPKLVDLKGHVTKPDTFQLDSRDTKMDDEQNQLISEAFADDDVIEHELDEAMKDSDDEKDNDLTDSAQLPGWNNWVGPGLIEKRRQNAKKRLTERLSKVKKRKMVIINEKSEDSIKKFQVKDVPFPYRDPRLFEENVSKPLGKEWNTQTSYKMLIEPNIKTKMGAIIQPMDSSYVLRKSKKQRLNVGHVTWKKGRKKASDDEKEEEPNEKHIEEEEIHISI